MRNKIADGGVDMIPNAAEACSRLCYVQASLRLESHLSLHPGGQQEACEKAGAGQAPGDP